ncbi:MAG: sigma-70 family RNA polymerase sigma factor [Chloroflexi bacterium]|nr:sigma-70 family RNA polymerase sigma factor [Chloroflexota bacterium]
MKSVVPNEAELLHLAHQFDRQALAQIYDLFSPGLFRYALRLLGDQTQAEECVADTFSRFLVALKKSKGPQSHLQAYLYRTAHNWVIDSYRAKTEIPVELDENFAVAGPGPEEQAGLHIRQEQVRCALRKLTPDQQQVIILKYLEGWENEQVARALDKPIGAVKSLQHRALTSLQRYMEKE